MSFDYSDIMTVAESYIHPLLLFAFQILATTLVIGFSASHSRFRLAVLPLVAACAYGIITTSPSCMRLHWASLLSGSSVGFVLQYVELALLSKWSFETRGEAVLNPSVSANRNQKSTQNGVINPDVIVNGNGHLEENGYIKTDGLEGTNIVTPSTKHARLNNDSKVMSATKTDPKELHASGDTITTLNRLYFGLTSTFSFRCVNTIYEVKNVPPFRNGRVPSTTWFLLQQLFVTLVCIIVVDGSTLPPPPPNPAELFAPEKTRFFTRLDEITSDEMTLRIVSTTIYWANMYAIMQGCVSASAILMVGLGLSPVESWRPFFGKPAYAYDLRGFWGKFWHQMLRQVLSNPASFITHQILHLKKGTLIARYINLFLTFVISGVLHSLAELAGGLPLTRSGTLSFFCIQAFGIMFEDAVKAAFGGQNSRGNELPPFIYRLLGYIWVALFLVWTTPGWLYPDAAGPPKASFLPFSLISTLIKYIS